MAGVDLGLVNQKQAEIEAAAAARGAGGFQFWNPAVGSNKFRLAPPWNETARSFEKALPTHFGVGENNNMFTCAGPGCVLCAHVAALRATGDPADAEVANRMSVKKRYYSNVIDLNDAVYTRKDVEDWKAKGSAEPCPFEEGQTKVQLFGYGAMVYGQLINLFAQLQQDLTDPNNGYDLILTKMGKELNTKYTIIPAPPAKPLAVYGKKSLDELLTDLDKILPAKSASDMQAALGVPVTAAPASLPPRQAPPSLPPAVQPRTPAPAPAAAPPPAVVQQIPASNVAAKPEDMPPCFKDKATFAANDVQCVGGEQLNPQTGQIERFEQCPGYQECGEFAGKLVPAAAARRRRTSVAGAVPNGAVSEADALEAQMRAALK